MVQAYRQIYAKNGMRSFFKGIAPSLLRSAPNNAICLVAYEFLSHELHSRSEPALY